MDIKLSYVEKGGGKPIILIHGNGEDHKIFKAQIADFSKEYHVFAVDTRGHGATPRGSKPFTISQFADDLNDFMDDKSIEKAHIFGFSDGANIAMAFAVKYPEKVDKLILNSGNFAVNGLKKTFLIPCKIRYIIAEKAGDKPLCELLKLMLCDFDIDESDLAKIKAKTLVIAGDRDLIKLSHTRLIAKSIPNSELKIIGGNHAVARIRPKHFDKIVLEFLAE
ncbi:MAG: alpha/beta hydrolase [Eubacterium sp.]|nr:alpha/beta hydrolase [Eubacterium sp.]